jgi:hypothetical protein
MMEEGVTVINPDELNNYSEDAPCVMFYNGYLAW